MKEKIKTVILWIWQFPQNILGYFLSRHYFCFINGTYWKDNWGGNGVSLGNYIIIDKSLMISEPFIIQHEKGHQKQSLMFGPLYLLVVGLPSISRNVWDRIMHRNWSAEKRSSWYYSSYPENWANKLGGVKFEI